MNKKRYEENYKQKIIRRMMPPNHEKVSKISKEVGITETAINCISFG
jgi:hypothetical protein